MVLLPVARTRESAFAYACHGCGRCCHGKTITVSPYEAARLGDALDLSTTEVFDRYIVPETRALRRTGDTACVFLTDGGCSVHTGRPLSCRLYPLGWFSDRQQHEAFAELAPHPETEGVYSTDGTVADYLAAQETAPFERAARRYAEVLWRLNASLGVEDGPDPGDPPHMTDVDAAVEAACGARGAPVPEDVEARVDLHLELLHRWLDAAGAPARS